MLKGIPSIISPDLLKILMEMGHGDELVIGDGNFPAARVAQRLVREDGHTVPELLEAILKLYPLDTYSDPVYIMQMCPATMSRLLSGRSLRLSPVNIPTSPSLRSSALSFMKEPRRRMQSLPPVRPLFMLISSSERALS